MGLMFKDMVTVLIYIGDIWITTYVNFGSYLQTIEKLLNIVHSAGV